MDRASLEATGDFLHAAATSLQLWLADFSRIAIHVLGEVGAQELAEQLDLELIADVLPSLEKRDERLTAEHHFVVARHGLSEEEQVRWLDVAAMEGLSARQMDASIGAGKVVRDVPRKAAAGVPTIQGVRALFDLWLRAVEDEIPKWNRERLEQLNEELSPIFQVAWDVKRKLADRK
jgi:hypothetical protein